MAVRDRVFASRAERENYYKLSRQWGEKYRIYHNLPFLNVFTTTSLVDWETLGPLTLEPFDGGRLKKTSIDYTLCDENDAPLLCIDFDGLNDGVNLGTRYHAERPADPWREQITELKLRVAHGSMFPYFVVGSKQFADLGKNLQVTVVDGVIGDVLSRKATLERFAKGFTADDVNMSQEEFDELTPWEQNEIVQDWALGIEVENEFEYNPITRLSAELQEKAGIRGHSWQYVEYPPISPDVPLEERVRLLERSTLMGAKCSVTFRGREVERTVWIPNFNTPYFSGLGLLEELGTIAATLAAINGET